MDNQGYDRIFRLAAYDHSHLVAPLGNGQSESSVDGLDHIACDRSMEGIASHYRGQARKQQWEEGIDD